MVVLVYTTERTLTAVLEPGVRPDTPAHIHTLTLKGSTDADFKKIRQIYEMLEDDADAAGIPITYEDGADQSDKLKAAANN